MAEAEEEEEIKYAARVRHIVFQVARRPECAQSGVIKDK